MATHLDPVARYYLRMAEENGPDAAMGYTLEMFEGLTEGQVDYALGQYRAGPSVHSTEER